MPSLLGSAIPTTSDLRGCIDVDHPRTEYAFRAESILRHERVAAADDGSRPDVQALPLLLGAELAEKRSVAAQVVRLELVQPVHNLSPGRIDVEPARSVENADLQPVDRLREGDRGKMADGGAEKRGPARDGSEDRHGAEEARPPLHPFPKRVGAIRHLPRRARAVNDHIAPVHQVGGLARVFQKRFDALPRQAGRRDDLVEVRHQLGLGHDGEVLGPCPSGVDPPLVDDSRVIRRMPL